MPEEDDFRGGGVHNAYRGTFDGLYEEKTYSGRKRKKVKEHKGRDDYYDDWGYEGGVYDWYNPSRDYYYPSVASDRWGGTSLWGSGGYTWSSPNQALNYIMNQAAHQRVSFLVKLWSTSKVSSVGMAGQRNTAMSANSNLETGNVTIPTLEGLMARLGVKDVKVSDPRVLVAWRMLRFSAWHESMHFQYTPVHWASMCQNHLPEVSLACYNVFEDAKVHDLGLEQYPGMVEEEAMFDGLMNTAYINGKDQVDSVLKPHEKFLFALSSVMSAVDPAKMRKHLPVTDAEMRIVEELKDMYLEAVKKYYEHKNLNTLSMDVLEVASEATNRIMELYPTITKKDLDSMFHRTSGESARCGSRDTPEQVGSLTKEEFKRLLKEMLKRGMNLDNNEHGQSALDASEYHNEFKARLAYSPCMDGDQENMERYMDQELMDLMKSMASSTPQSIATELSDILEQRNMAEKYKQALGTVQQSASVMSTSTGTINQRTYEGYVNRDVLSHILSALRKWKDSYEQTFGEVGLDLDMDRLLLSELKESPVVDYYVTDEKTRPMDYILIILDTSSSMDRVIEDYKEALITMCTAMDTMRTKYAIAVFNSGFENEVKMVKPFDKKMGFVQKQIMSLISTSGMTPLGQTLQTFMATGKLRGVDDERDELRDQFARAKYVLVVTDGEPSDEEVFVKYAYRLTNLRTKDHMYVGIAETSETRRRLALSYNKFLFGYGESSSLGQFTNVNKRCIKKEKVTIVSLKELPKLVVNMILKGKYV